jgi:tRNA(Ile)-lysidine synthase
MNEDPRFERVRVRRLLPLLAGAGLTAAVLAATADRCSALAAEIDAAVDDLVAAAVAVDPFAVVTVGRKAFAAAPGPVRERLLVRLLRAIGGGDYPPRSERLGALGAALSAPDDRRLRRTLAGTVVEAGADVIRLWREVGRRGLPHLDVPPGYSGVWDGRYSVVIPPGAPPGLSLGALGALRPTGVNRPPRLPPGAAAALPALFAGTRLVAVPAWRWSADGMPGEGFTVAECVSARILRPAPFPSLAPGD